MKTLVQVMILAAVASLTSCKTWEAFKEDTNEIGKSVEEAAKNTAEEINQADK